MHAHVSAGKLYLRVRWRGQGLFRNSSKWCPWEPLPEVLQILDRREAEGRIQGVHHIMALYTLIISSLLLLCAA